LIGELPAIRNRPDIRRKGDDGGFNAFLIVVVPSCHTIRQSTGGRDVIHGRTILSNTNFHSGDN
jgi:hypothetical protein